MFKFAVTIVMLMIGVWEASCEENDYSPDIYPGTCPSIMPSQNFQVSQLVGFWHATHYVNAAFFNGSKCLGVNFRQLPTGMEVDMRMIFNNSEVNATTKEMPTKVPGVYSFSMADDEDESQVVTGTEVYFVHEDHLLLWGCVQINENNHDEFVLILSLTGEVLEAVVKLFKRHLNNQGSRIKKFYAFPEARCVQELK